MKANELRIGNWVQLENRTPYQVQHHHFELNEDGYNECLDLSIPIPLTEEWLLKFGLEKTIIEDLIGNKVEGHEIPLSDFFVDERNGVYLNCFYTDIYLENVHQLQNLYFALTGEELKPKP